MEPVHQTGFVKNFFLVFLDDFLCSLKGITFHLDQLIYKSDFFNIVFSEPSIAFFVFFGFDYIKFTLPIPNQ